MAAIGLGSSSFARVAGYSGSSTLGHCESDSLGFAFREGGGGGAHYVTGCTVGSTGYSIAKSTEGEREERCRIGLSSCTLFPGRAFRDEISWVAPGPTRCRFLNDGRCECKHSDGMHGWHFSRPQYRTSRSRQLAPPIEVSVTPVAAPHGDAEEYQYWGLQDEIKRIRDILVRLQEAKTLDDKDSILSNDPRVRSVFGSGSQASFGPGRTGTFVKPAVALALAAFTQAELYLLKCLVACGQEHVLNTPPGWEDEFGDLEEADGIHDTQTSRSGVKDAFAALANMIDGWESDKKSVVDTLFGGWDSAGVFPSQLMELMDWEGWYPQKPGESLISQLLKGLENPGVFPAPVIELMDFEGRFEKAPTRIGFQTDSNCDCPELPRPQRSLHESLAELVRMLARLEKFYDAIGGLLGYQLASLELIQAADTEMRGEGGALPAELGRRFLVPKGQDLAQDKEFADQAAIWGLQGMPEMGEIYPLGGAGDRLGLVDEKTGECLPVAMLPYCGRTLLQGLIRDLQAREYLHYCVTGHRCLTPVAIMTSAAKQNHWRVQGLCESHGWFGRGRHNFRLFEQPLVPTVAAADGRWLANEPLSAVLKPGGHGAIWKLACDEGVFDWFRSKGRKAAMVRQISNPFAATDVTMLALSGVGLRENKKFGFASCDRNVGTAEGVNVLTETRRADGRWEYGVTCIEYTEFAKLGIADASVSPGSMRSQFPANTNVLYVDLQAVEAAAATSPQASLPGLIMNLKKPVSYMDHYGRRHSVRAGRLECTMQNIADCLTDTVADRLSPDHQSELSTFLLYNERRKVTSSAKRRRKPTDLSLHQTPDGSVLDLQRNAAELFTSCGVAMPKMETNQCYLEAPPPFMVLFHPALGPLWDVIRQKVRGGSLAAGSEVQLEVAELAWQDVEVAGSLLVHAVNAMGELEGSGSGEPILQYGQRCGRCRLQRVRVHNRGVDWECPENVYWQHKVRRWEALHIVLHGDAEFHAADVTIEGAHSFEVPAGHRMSVTSGASGMECRLERLPDSEEGSPLPSWRWLYSIEEQKRIVLTLQETVAQALM